MIAIVSEDEVDVGIASSSSKPLDLNIEMKEVVYECKQTKSTLSRLAPFTIEW